MTVSANDKDIKIPAKHYVGFQKRGADEIPLGFMTPDGTDAAATKRKDTVDNWARGRYWNQQNKPSIAAQSFDNQPMLGFKLGKTVRHGYGWGQGNVKWRIEDPRGFELEISSPNLAQILDICIVDQGEIQEKCVWGRLKNENILIPVNSDVYKAAQANTERMGKKASLKDLKPGYRILLHNGAEGVYLGKFFPLVTDYDNRNRVFCEEKTRAFYGTLTDGKITDLSATSSLKLSEIYEDTEITSAEGEKLINDAIIRGVSVSLPGYRRAKGVSAKRVDKADIHYTFVPFADYADLLAKGISHPSQPNNSKYNTFVEKDGVWGEFSIRYYHHQNPNVGQASVFDRTAFDGGAKFDYLKHTVSRGSYYYGDRYETHTFEVDITDPTARWHLLQINFKTTHGYEYNDYTDR